MKRRKAYVKAILFEGIALNLRTALVSLLKQNNQHYKYINAILKENKKQRVYVSLLCSVKLWNRNGFGLVLCITTINSLHHCY